MARNGARSRMKGQFIFEFLIAGFIFFGIIIFSINYLNTNVNEFKASYLKDELAGKAVWISQMLTTEATTSSNLSLVERWPYFSMEKIAIFNETYCAPGGGFQRLKSGLNVEKETEYTTKPLAVRIILNSRSASMVCEDSSRGLSDIAYTADVRRVGVLNGEYAMLDIFVGEMKNR
jgi:hypothetical protein